MGQKANPNAMRTGIVKDWKSRYYPNSNKDWATYAVQDRKIRDHFNKNQKAWGLSLIEIDRTSTSIKVKFNTSRPGVILGENGDNVKTIERDIAKIIKNKDIKIEVDVYELKNPALDAKIVANEIAFALENRASFRMAQKKAIRNTMRSGAKGIKTQISGRLNGVDMARTEGYSEGQIPLQTLRQDVDYALALAHTTYGVFGVKVWISRGEVLSGYAKEPQAAKPREFKPRGPRKPRPKRGDE